MSQPRSPTFDAFAWHLEQLGEHPCCWIVDGDECGLLCGHDGDHTGHQIGAYLPLPLLTATDLVLLQLVLHRPFTFRPPCPNCCTATDGWFCERMAFCDFEADGWRVTEGVLWRFEPCRCEAREVIA